MRTGTSVSRSAIIASLALHAILIFILGALSFPAGNIGSGPVGADAPSFFSADSAGSLLSDDAPAALPEPVSIPQITEPNLTQPAQTEISTAVPIHAFAALPTQLPEAIVALPVGRVEAVPDASSSKTGKTNRRTPARGGENSGAGQKPGVGGGGGLNSGYVPPQFLVRNKPPYPEEARLQRLEGTVVLLVSIDAAGHVTNSSVQGSCGYPVLDRAALEAVRSWRFNPARQDGVAIAARVEVPVRFRFEERFSTRSH